jgi:hypothetical protein
MSVGCLHRRKTPAYVDPTRLGAMDRDCGHATAPAIERHEGPRERPANAMRPHTSSWPSPPLAPSTPATTRSRPLLVDTWFADEDDSQSIWTACECWAIYHLPDLNTARGRTSTTASPRFACLRVQVVLTFPTPGERGNNRQHALFGDSNTAVGHNSDVYRTSRSRPSPTGQVASQPTDIDGEQ